MSLRGEVRRGATGKASEDPCSEETVPREKRFKCVSGCHVSELVLIAGTM